MSIVDVDLKLGIARILKPNGTTAGTGFVIHRNGLILTCAHVLQSSIPENTPNSGSTTVELEFWATGERCRALAKRELCWPDQLGDMALLTVEGGLPDRVYSLPLGLSEGSCHHAFKTFGFPRAKPVEGMSGYGTIGDATVEAGCPVLQLTGTTEVTYGFSGAPVLDTVSGHVIGIVSSFTLPDSAGRSSQTAFITPIETLLKLHPPLESLLQINKTKVGSWTAPEVLLRWVRWQSEWRAQLLCKDLDCHDYQESVISPLQPLWKQFIGEPGWHEKVESLLGRMLDEASAFADLRSLVQRIRSIDCSAGYDQLLTRLRPISTVKVEREVSQLLALLEKETGTSGPTGKTYGLSEEEERVQRARQLRGNIIRLRELIEKPKFGKCFLLLGSLGAGKTHWIASLLENPDVLDTAGHQDVEQIEPVVLFLRLSPTYGDRPLSELFLHGAREASGMSWSSVDELHRFFESYRAPARSRDTGVKMTVVVDDLHEWMRRRPSFGGELTDFVREHTHLHNLYWLIAAQDIHYDQLARTGSRFWEEYSLFQRMERRDIKGDSSEQSRFTTQWRSRLIPQIGGWIVLDDLNEDEGIGLQLLHKALANLDQDELLALDMAGRASPAQRALANLFNVWILFDLREQLDLRSLVTLYYVEFVNLFWERRKAAIDLGSLSAAQLEQTINLIAKVVFETGDLRPRLTEMLDGITAAARGRSEIQDRGQANFALQLLVRANLLSRVEEPDPEMPEQWDERIEMRSESFWALQLARQLRRSDAIQGQQRVETQAELARQFAVGPEDIKEGVLYFVLLLLQDRAYGELALDFVRDVWVQGIDTERLPRAAFWFAGVKASEMIQQSLVTWAQKLASGQLLGRQLFAFMHFVSESAPSVLGAPGRLAALQPHFSAIRSASIEAYYFHIASQILDQIEDMEILLACMSAFAGCEILGIAPDLASLTFDAMVRLARHDAPEILEMVLRFLSLESARLGPYLGSPEAEQGRGKGQESKWIRQGYREWLLYKFCSHLVYYEGMHAYDLLNYRHWYGPEAMNLHYPVTLEMEREATIAFGFWYRSRSGEHDKQAFVELVSELSHSSNTRSKRLAFHLIRHTEPTHERKAIKVGKVFHPALSEIARDPRLRTLVERFSEFFEANLGISKTLTPAPRHIDRSKRPRERTKSNEMVPRRKKKRR